METLYMKIEQSIELSKREVTIGDVAALECAEQEVVNRLKAEKLFCMEEKNYSRKVVSALFVIQRIHRVYPMLEICNLGETDFVVNYHSKKQSAILEKLKIAFVCGVSFFGSMFAMMTFNEDVSTRESFDKVYEWVLGTPAQGVTILDITYSVGISVGIILFFNHLGKKYITAEPSPVEVEMSGYEQQINDTLIKQAGRNGREADVD